MSKDEKYTCKACKNTFIVKYANLWGFCCRRRGCVSSLKPGFHIIAPVATIVAVVEKRVLTQKYFLSDASDTVFPYDRRCRSIS